MKRLSFFAALAVLFSLTFLPGHANAFIPGATPQQFAQVHLAAATNIKSGATRLRSIHAMNRNAAGRYLQVFNSTGGTGTVYYQWLIPSGSWIELGNDFFMDEGWSFPTGLTVGISTTDGSYVAATDADHDFGGSYY